LRLQAHIAMPAKEKPDLVLPQILEIRGLRVVMDRDLAALYGVATYRLNEAVKRNIERFPDDFCFQLSREEAAAVLRSRSQIAILNTQSIENQQSGALGSSTKGKRRGQNLKYLPWAFTEHGALMAGNVLRSPRAVQMSLYVVRAFVRMREELLANATILKRLSQIDRKLLEHDVVLRDVVEKLMPLLSPSEGPPKRKIGFHTGNR
jgi:hypothetical protein